MAVFKYTLIKYLKAKSTWAILLISLLVTLLLGSWLPFRFINPSKTTPAEYTVTIVSLVAGLTSFLAIFTSVFAGFKGASMFKDEVEDGTFLIILSKPITRANIILFKWFAMQTVFIVYTFIVAFSFAIGISIFDNGAQLRGLNSFGINTLKSSIGVVCLYIWMILFVVGLIFSSIAILISTRLSVGATVGIAITLGVLIPVTAIVGMFARKQEYEELNGLPALNTSKLLSPTTLAPLIYEGGPITLEEVEKATAEFNQLIQHDKESLFNLGIETGSVDGYVSAWLADLDFQIKTLSQFASESSVSSEVRNFAASAIPGQGLGLTTSSVRADGNEGINGATNQQIELDKMIQHTFEKTSGIRRIILKSNASLFYSSNPAIPALIDLATPTSKEIKVTSQLAKSLNDFHILNRTDWVAEEELTIAALKEIFNTDTGPISELNLIDDNTTDANEILRLTSIYDLMHFTNRVFAGRFGTYFNFSSIPGIELTPQNIVNLFDQSASISSWIVEPLLFWIDYATLASQLDKQNFVPGTGAITLPDASKSVAYAMLASEHDNDQTFAYERLVQASEKDIRIAKIIRADYVNKNHLLGFYLIIAFILVPITYVVIRKQDFR